jgi:hypothetical protein
MLFFDLVPVGSTLPLVITVTTLAVTLLLLAYLNFKNFRSGWPLWRRNLLVMAGAAIFVVASSTALYNRVWEFVEPAEPPHGLAKLSLAHPPSMQLVQYQNLLVRLPDGRVWFDSLSGTAYDSYGGFPTWKFVWQSLAHPLRESLGPRQFLAGSNWVAATTEHMYFSWNDAKKRFLASDFMETVGIQPDGTLWLSDKPAANHWTPGNLHQFGSETNWRQVAQSRTSVVLLKSDGTLWCWGSFTNDFRQWLGLPTFTAYQIGANAGWQDLFTLVRVFARNTNGSVWTVNMNWKTGRDELVRATNFDEIISPTASRAFDNKTAFIRADGTLWLLNWYWDEKTRQMVGTGSLQVGKENDWRAVAVNFGQMVAIKSDGSLWRWPFAQEWNVSEEELKLATQETPVRLGIHNDWVALANTGEDVITLAADGSLWLWPDREHYEQYSPLKLPKQPGLLGNIFSTQP